jgi:histone-lysine N-methyltransferase SETMAR
MENTEFTSAEKARMSRLQFKIMLVCFFDHKGIVHYEFIAQVQTVNKSYLEMLTRLRETVRRKRPELCPDKWIFYHDNAPAHDTLRFREFMTEKSITNMDHPPYSLDLAPCDFWLFPKLKNALKGQRFADIPDIVIARYSGKRIFNTVSGSGTIISRSV